jgi:large subunit ribosomal protein L29
MKEVKMNDLRGKSEAELEEMLAQERVALYQTRRDLVFRKTTDTTSMKTRRHNIARIMTLMTEMKKSGAAK